MKGNLFVKLKAKLGHYLVVLTSVNTSPEKRKLTVVELSPLPHIEKTDSKKELSYLNWIKKHGRGKICVYVKTDTDKLNVVVYRYRNNLFLKDSEIGLKLTEYHLLVATRVYLLSYMESFTNDALY